MTQVHEHLMKLAFRVGFSDIALNPKKADETMKSLEIISEGFEEVVKVIEILRKNLEIVAAGETFIVSKKNMEQVSKEEHDLIVKYFGLEI